MTEYASLHNHTYYSIRDGVSSPIELCSIAKETGYNAVAITDHGTISGWLQFRDAAKEIGIKPIYGIEIYVKIKNDTYHMTLLAKNTTGISNIIKIINTNLNNYDKSKKRSFVLLDDIPQDFGKGIICLTGCIFSPISHFLFEGKKNDWIKKEITIREDWKQNVTTFLQSLQQKFEHVFIEIQYHKLAAQSIFNKHIIPLAKDLKIDVVATLDSHFPRKDDAEIQQLIYAATPEKKHYTPLVEAWHKSVKELPEIPIEFFENTQIVNDLIDCQLEDRPSVVPEIPIAQSLKDIAIKELERRQFPSHYKERLLYEIDVIYKYNMQNYFAIIYDFCQYARKNNFAVGVGRGSVCGSLFAYLLGITQVDPIIHKLYFERFINPGRFEGKIHIQLDIDLDFSPTDRDKIVAYLKEKYGEHNVCNIGTFNYIHERNAIWMAARALNYHNIEKQCINYVERFNSIEEAIQSKEFNNLSDMQQECIQKAQKLIGRIDSVSTHAAGIVIANDITSNFPLRKDDNEEIVIDFDKDDVERLGGVKFDLLRLNQLEKFNIIKQYVNVEFIDSYRDFDINMPTDTEEADILTIYFNYLRTRYKAQIQEIPRFPLSEVSKYNLPFEDKTRWFGDYKITINNHSYITTVLNISQYKIPVTHYGLPNYSLYIADKILLVQQTDIRCGDIFIINSHQFKNIIADRNSTINFDKTTNTKYVIPHQVTLVQNSKHIIINNGRIMEG